MRSLFLNPPDPRAGRSERGGWMPTRLSRLAGGIPSVKLVDARVEGCSSGEIPLLARGFDRVFVDAGWRPSDARRTARALKASDPRVRLAAVVHAGQPAPDRFAWDARIEYGDAEAARAFARVDAPSGGDEMDVYERDLRVERYQVPILSRPYLGIDANDRSPAEIAQLASEARSRFPSVRELYLVGSPASAESGRAEALAQAMTPVGIRWSCAMEPTLPGTALAALSKSGLGRVRARFRSGSDALLTKRGFPYDAARARDFAEDCRRFSIAVHGLFVLGGEGENEATLAQTRRFALSLPLESIQTNLRAEGGSYSRKALRREARRLSRRFYLRPRMLFARLARTLREADDRPAALRDANAFFTSAWTGRTGVSA